MYETRLTDLDAHARSLGARNGADTNGAMAAHLGHTYIRGMLRGGPVLAYVNHGRWLATCPFCGKAAHVSVSRGEFYCLGCGLAENDGYPMRATFPDDLEAIEAALLGRPAENQNWTPGETVDDLQRENAAHGIGGAL